MATKQMPVRVDDLDGTVLYDEGRSTTIVLDGERVELDLSIRNYEALREMLAPYFKAAGKGFNGRRTVGPSTVAQPTQRTDKEGLKKIREWATKNGYKVSARGRIPYSVMDAYAKTHVS